ncbi:MAG: hypothetical protein K8F36_05525 [Melioribacteraceae bacterium]|nr:hypothetical protein [Melioribacteraceae bacterium]
MFKILILLLMLFCIPLSSKLAQPSQNNFLYSNSTVCSTFKSNSTIHERLSKMPVTFQTSIHRYYFNKFNFNLKLGFAPIKAGISFGYLFQNKVEVLGAYNLLLFPMLFNARSINLGVKIFTSVKQNFFYDLVFGLLYKKQSDSTFGYDGYVSECGIGYKLIKNNYFYIDGQLRLDILFRRSDSILFIPGIDFAMGWYL